MDYIKTLVSLTFILNTSWFSRLTQPSKIWVSKYIWVTNIESFLYTRCVGALLWSPVLVYLCFTKFRKKKMVNAYIGNNLLTSLQIWRSKKQIAVRDHKVSANPYTQLSLYKACAIYKYTIKVSAIIIWAVRRDVAVCTGLIQQLAWWSCRFRWAFKVWKFYTVNVGATKTVKNSHIPCSLTRWVSLDIWNFFPNPHFAEALKCIMFTELKMNKPNFLQQL